MRDRRAIALLRILGVMETSHVSDPTAGRNQLVMNHVQMVRAVACRLAHRLPRSVELSELIGVGTLALVDAAGRYRTSRGVPFEAFARQRVHGAMLDALRGMDWAPRSVRRKQRAIGAATNRLRHELGREPQGVEVAAALGLTPANYEKALDDVRGAELAAARLASCPAQDESLIASEFEGSGDQHAQLERAELAGDVAAALTRLPERERRVLAMYYQDEMTLAEIGAAMGVSESRISQLRSQAIGRLRALLRPIPERRSAQTGAGAWPASALAA